MFGRLAKSVLKAALFGSLLTRLCLPAEAMTTTDEAGPSAIHEGEGAAAAIVPAAFTPAETIRRAGDTSVPQQQVTVALLLPLRSGTLREAAEVVRAGFQAAYEREYDHITVNIIETDDTPQDILAGYGTASAQADIIVGPLSRAGVTAIVLAGVVEKPTLALTPPDHTVDDNTASKLPAKLLAMGLSIEEEARQVADWAGKGHANAAALVLFTKQPWQRRAAKAFELQWQRNGGQAEVIELGANDGFLNGRALLQLKKQIRNDASQTIFLALDAHQARQVRAMIGPHPALYGTSQANPLVLSAGGQTGRSDDMDGMHLLDMPWQLQPDHPAVMAYSRMNLEAGRTPDADLERLYALGIDAYRVAREIAAQRTRFDLDGVTGKLSVRYEADGAHFVRTEQQAVYRDGIVMPEEELR